MHWFKDELYHLEKMLICEVQRLCSHAWSNLALAKPPKWTSIKGSTSMCDSLWQVKTKKHEKFKNVGTSHVHRNQDTVAKMHYNWKCARGRKKNISKLVEHCLSSIMIALNFHSLHFYAFATIANLSFVVLIILASELLAMKLHH